MCYMLIYVNCLASSIILMCKTWAKLCVELLLAKSLCDARDQNKKILKKKI